MSNAILHKRRISNPTPPSYTDLILGELAMNTVTARIFMRDRNDAVIDIGTNIIDVICNYVTTDGVLTPVSMELNGSIVSDLVMHKGLGYTFRIPIEGQVENGISGTDIIFYTQANEGAAHQEYTATVRHHEYSATIYIPLDAPDNFKFGIRDNGSNNAIEGSGGSIIYSDKAGGGSGGGSGEYLSSADAVFEWDTQKDVWRSGSDEGLQSSSGKLILGDTTINTSSNVLSFGNLTTLSNVLIDAGDYS